MSGQTREPTTTEWLGVAQALDREGWAIIPNLTDPAACDAIATLYEQ